MGKRKSYMEIGEGFFGQQLLTTGTTGKPVKRNNCSVPAYFD